MTLLPLPAGNADPLREATVRVLGYANRRHGLGFQVVRLLPSGSYLVRDADREAVLRWSRDPGAPLAIAGAFASGATPRGHAYALSARRGAEESPWQRLRSLS